MHFGTSPFSCESKGSFFCVLVLFALCLPAHLSARQADRLEDIVVKSDFAFQSRQDISAFTGVIEPSRFSRQFRTVSELVEHVTGLAVRRYGGLGQLSTVSIRGSSAEQVVVLVDGVRLNTPSGGAVDFSTIPLENVERIEIIRGGGAAKFGTDAIGGVVNIITKKPHKDQAAALRFTAGSFYTFKSHEFVSKKYDNISFLLSHTHFSSEGNYSFKSAVANFGGVELGTGKSFTRVNSGFVSEAFLSKLEAEFGDAKVGFTNDFFFADREVPGPEIETTLLASSNPVEAKELIVANRTTIEIDVTNFLAPAVDLKFGLHHYGHWDDFEDPSPALGDAIHRHAFDNSLAGYATLVGAIDAGWANHVLTVRHDLRRDYFKDSSPIDGSHLIGKRTRYFYSLFLMDEISLIRDRVCVAPSVRFENASDFGGLLNWKMGLLVKPRKWVALKSNIESSSRYPNFSELYFPDHGFIKGNPYLKEEEAINFDVGMTLQFKNLRLEGAYFRNFVGNSILFVPISATTIQPINTYDVDVEGVEAMLNFELSQCCFVVASYTFLDAHFANSKKQLPGRVRHKVSSRFTVQLFDVTAYIDGVYQSRLPVNVQNTVFVGDRFSLNTGMSYNFGPHKQYYVSADFKDVTNVQLYDARGYPLPRFSFFITVGVNV